MAVSGVRMIGLLISESDYEILVADKLSFVSCNQVQSPTLYLSPPGLTTDSTTLKTDI